MKNPIFKEGGRGFAENQYIKVNWLKKRGGGGGLVEELGERGGEGVFFTGAWCPNAHFEWRS